MIGTSLGMVRSDLKKNFTLQAEQAATTVDFENYKVRVHNVLKQQKNRTAAQNENELTQQEK